jgi:hypothetical protein
VFSNFDGWDYELFSFVILEFDFIFGCTLFEIGISFPIFDKRPLGKAWKKEKMLLEYY